MLLCAHKMSKRKPLLSVMKTLKSYSWLLTDRKVEDYKKSHILTLKSKVKRRKTKKSCKKSKKVRMKDEGPQQYTFYCIINTNCSMNLGHAAGEICRCFLTLHEKLSIGRNEKYLEKWEDEGERILVFRGYDSRHLFFMKKAVSDVAVDLHAHYQMWGKMRTLVVLTIFGQDAELEEYFAGLEQL